MHRDLVPAISDGFLWCGMKSVVQLIENTGNILFLRCNIGRNFILLAPQKPFWNELCTKLSTGWAGAIILPETRLLAGGLGHRLVQSSPFALSLSKGFMTQNPLISLRLTVCFSRANSRVANAK